MKKSNKWKVHRKGYCMKNQYYAGSSYGCLCSYRMLLCSSPEEKKRAGKTRQSALLVFTRAGVYLFLQPTSSLQLRLRKVLMNRSDDSKEQEK